MWVKWYRRGVLIVLVAFMLLGGSYCFLEWKQGQFEQEVSTSEIDENLVKVALMLMFGLFSLRKYFRSTEET